MSYYYAVDSSGMATLCVDLQDAIESAKEYAELYPKRAPYVVATMVPIDAIETISEKDAQLAEYRRILDGLPQDTIDGGWTAKGASEYAKRIEAERDRLREALGNISHAANHENKEAQWRIKAARAALTQQEQV